MPRDVEGLGSHSGGRNFEKLRAEYLGSTAWVLY